MASAMKFLFDKSFDVDEHPADQGSAPNAAQYTEQDLLAARAEAHAEGESAGRSAALASIEQTSAKALAGMAAQLGNIGKQIDTLRNETVRDALKVVSAAIHKIVPELAGRNGLNEIERLIKECLHAIYDEPRVVVRAHDTVIAALQGRIDAMAASCGFNGKIVLFGDDQLGQNDCRIEWADGGAERSLDEMWQKIEAALTRMTASAEAASPAPTQTSQPS